MTGERPIRVLFVDDHPIVRDGLAALIGGQPDMQVVGGAANAEQAIEQFRRHQPDVTLMDLQLPGRNGAEAISDIRKEFPRARVIVLSIFARDEDIRQSLGAGASGYLLKEALPVELVEGIRAAHRGERPLSPEITARWEAQVRGEALTARERDILLQVMEGRTDRQAAANLGISELTVKGHVKMILAKLRVSNRTEAVAQAIKRGILRLE
jgi:DNA-binding NarL/FixJ family response regulator